MSLGWYLLSFLLMIGSCHSQTKQMCFDSCQFDHRFDANLTIPSSCKLVERIQCNVVLTFDYSARSVHINFNGVAHERRDDVQYTTETVAHSFITLGDESSSKNVIEYSCSTGDRCEYDYIIKQALPLYILKTCIHFRAHLIALLHADPASQSRECLISNASPLNCTEPCDLFYVDPTLTLRACDGQRSFAFETTVGRTTPINKPDYNHRLYAYACTTPLCNGEEMQKRIENLMDKDNGECLIDLNTHHNKAISFAKPFLLIVCALIFLVL